MDIEFRKAILPDELDDLLDFDRRVFGSLPDDLFEPEDWASCVSFWMFADGVKVGCCAVEPGCDYDQQPRAGCLYIASTGILPQCQGEGLGRKQKDWQIEYARDHGFTVIVTNMRESNERIRKLNESVGFKFRCLARDYYQAPCEGAVVMELYLAPDNGPDH